MNFVQLFSFYWALFAWIVLNYHFNNTLATLLGSFCTLVIAIFISIWLVIIFNAVPITNNYTLVEDDTYTTSIEDITTLPDGDIIIKIPEEINKEYFGLNLQKIAAVKSETTLENPIIKITHMEYNNKILKWLFCSNIYIHSGTLYLNEEDYNRYT